MQEACMKLVRLMLVIVVATGCSRKPGEGATPPAPATDKPTLDPRLDKAPMSELSFVPVDGTEALVRVDLADVAARSPDPAESLKTFDFLLRAQQPSAWSVLNKAGVT